MKLPGMEGILCAVANSYQIYIESGSYVLQQYIEKTSIERHAGENPRQSGGNSLLSPPSLYHKKKRSQIAKKSISEDGFSG